MMYDPDRKLWQPGRRSFLFLFSAAIAGALVPVPDVSIKNNASLLAAAGWETTSLKIGDTFTLSGVYRVNQVREVFVVTAITDSVINLDRAAIVPAGQDLTTLR